MGLQFGNQRESPLLRWSNKWINILLSIIIINNNFAIYININE